LLIASAEKVKKK